MNILIDELPKTLTIDGEECPIRYDFKTWIKFTQICSKEVNAKEVAEIFALIFFKLPRRFDEAVRAIMEFYVPKKLVSSKQGEQKSKRVYDFDFDSDSIYSAFLQQYKIDLCTAELHWCQFKALLDNLSEETQFVKILQYRSVDLSQIKDKEQKKFYTKMKKLHALPDNRTEKQKEDDFNSTIAGLFS